MDISTFRQPLRFHVSSVHAKITIYWLQLHICCVVSVFSANVSEAWLVSKCSSFNNAFLLSVLISQLSESSYTVKWPEHTQMEAIVKVIDHCHVLS